MTTEPKEVMGQGREDRLAYPILMFCGLTIAGVMVFFSWIGWIGSDDARHISGALGWYDAFPFVPEQHGAFRHFIAIPSALSFALLGISEYSAVLPILLYYFGILVITLHEVNRRVDVSAALLSVALLASLSIFSVRATVAYADIAEAFFVIASFWCFLHCCERTERRWALLLTAGFLAGAGWLTRETTAALLLLYGLLFLAGFGMPRRFYWVMAIGFFIPVLADAIYFAITTGSPIYRYTETVLARVAFRSMNPQTGDLFNDIGNVQLHPLLDPFLALLVNHEMGLTFYLVPFVVFGLWKDRAMNPTLRQLALLLMLFALLWFAVTTLAVTRYHPRYFTVSAYATLLATAIWLTQSLLPRRPRLCVGIAALLLIAGAAGIYVENRNPIYGARTLTSLAATSEQVIHSDPETVRRAHLLLLAENATSQTSAAPPEAGDIFLYNPNRVRKSSRLCAFEPAADWEIVETFKEKPKVIAHLINGLGLANLIHPSIERRLLRPNAPVVLYRVGKESTCPA